METRLNYVLIGTFFVLSLVGLALFVYWFGKHDRSLDEYNQYYLRLEELPKGVRKETIVRYLGIPVGFVKDYTLEYSNTDNVKVILWVKNNVVLQDGAKVIVDSQGLTGSVFLTLMQGSGAILKSNSELFYEHNWIEKVSTKAEQLMETMDLSLKRFNLLLSDENLENINVSLQNFKNVTHTLNDTLTTVKNEIRSFDRIVGEFERSMYQGDYNLKMILSPLVFDAQKLIFSGQGVVDNLQDSPNDFLFGKTQDRFGPRE